MNVESAVMQEQIKNLVGEIDYVKGENSSMVKGLNELNVTMVEVAAHMKHSLAGQERIVQSIIKTQDEQTKVNASLAEEVKGISLTQKEHNVKIGLGAKIGWTTFASGVGLWVSKLL